MAAWERILNHPAFEEADERFRLAAWNDAAGAYLRRYWARGQLPDLNQALELWQQAVDLTPEGHPDRPTMLNNLANGLRDRYARTGTLQDLEDAISHWQQAIQRGLEVAPEVALGSARNWGRSAFERGAWEEALQAYEAGRQAIDRLLEAQLLRSGKEIWLREAQELPVRHAYTLVQLGQIREAVEALEGGRARLLAEALERNRRDLEYLADLGYESLLARYRALSEQWEALIAQLEGRASPPPGETGATFTPDPARIAEALRQVDADLKAVIAEIRQIPGYEDFLLPPTFEKIARAAQDAPLVYLLATPAGGLALIVHGDEVYSVDLPALTAEAVRHRVEGSGRQWGGYLGAMFRWRRSLLPTTPPKERWKARTAWLRALESTTRWLWEAAMGRWSASLPTGAGTGLCSSPPATWGCCPSTPPGPKTQPAPPADATPWTRSPSPTSPRPRPWGPRGRRGKRGKSSRPRCWP